MWRVYCSLLNLPFFNAQTHAVGVCPMTLCEGCIQQNKNTPLIRNDYFSSSPWSFAAFDLHPFHFLASFLLHSLISTLAGLNVGKLLFVLVFFPLIYCFLFIFLSHLDIHSFWGFFCPTSLGCKKWTTFVFNKSENENEK